MERLLESAAVDIRDLRERVIKLEHEQESQSAHRHALASSLTDAIAQVTVDLGELKSAIREFDTAAPEAALALSEKERRSAALLTWLSENWKGAAAIAALVAWLLSLFGVDLAPGGGGD